MFSKFGLCLKTIQSVLNLFEKFFELFFVENVFVHLFEFVLKMSLNIPSKKFLKTCLKHCLNVKKRFKTYRNA